MFMLVWYSVFMLISTGCCVGVLSFFSFLFPLLVATYTYQGIVVYIISLTILLFYITFGLFNAIIIFFPLFSFVYYCVRYIFFGSL